MHILNYFAVKKTKYNSWIYDKLNQYKQWAFKSMAYSQSNRQKLLLLEKQFNVHNVLWLKVFNDTTNSSHISSTSNIDN